MKPFRSYVLSAFGLAVAGTIAATSAVVAGEKHALSLLGEPEYGPDFKHFKWVNPNAPKGGTVRSWSQGTFDSLNQYTPRGNSAIALSLIYDNLMTNNLNRGSEEYGLVAESVSYPEDYSSATFKLRAGAKFHDGKPITPEDVVFTLGALKKAHPSYAFYYKNVVKVEKTGERSVTFSFDVKGNRELPQIVGQLPVLPKHYWTATGKDGKPRDLGKSTLEVPLGSGPYRIKTVKPARYIVYERVKDYWAKDLPVNVGQWNFDEIRYDYYRDSTVAFEAFKSGRIDYWQETSSKRWATDYTFPALNEGKVKKETIDLFRPISMQAFVMNTRRSKFQDRLVRQAFNYAFDFEWANQNLFYGQYKRVGSYFQGQELAASGLPEGRELEILTELKGQIPEDVFTTEFKNPVNANKRAFRKNMRQASRLLTKAGWKIKDGVRVNAKGEKLEVEFLLVSPLFERIVLPYAKDLKQLGIISRVRVIDASQYRARLDNFDFDIVVGNFGQSESPGNEQRDFWGSVAADKKGSRNLIGIKDKAIDALIDKIIFAKDRKELVAATRALDRVLLAHHFVVPQWYVGYARLAHKSFLKRPETMPRQSVGFEQIWWAGEDKQAANAQ